MILLSSTNISITIVSIVIMLGIAGFVFFTKSTKDKQKAKESAEAFLSGLADEFYKLMVEHIRDFDLDSHEFVSVEDYQEYIMNEIYDTLYDYTMIKISEASKDDLLTTLAIKMLDKETIRKMAESVFNNGDIKGLIKDTWAKFFENKVEEIEEDKDIPVGHDIEGNEIIYSGNDYNEDFDEKNDLPVVKEENIDENALSNIIPPSEDENTSFNEDLIMEEDTNSDNPEELPIGYSDTEISTKDEDLPYFIDKNGRKRDKITGRYTK